MSRIWKDFRTNLMYWRFRHITRNRLRLQTWARHRGSVPVPRPRASAAYVYHRSGRRVWIVLLVMVALLTAIQVLPQYVALAPSLSWGLSALVVVGAVYWALHDQ